MSDLGDLFQDDEGNDRLPTFDEVRYILISVGVPEALANEFAAGDQWKPQALSNPDGFVDYLKETAPRLVEDDKERQRAENKADAGKKPAPTGPKIPPQPAKPEPKPTLAPTTATPAPTSTPVDVDQEIRDQYPAFAWLLDTPQIGDLLRQSVTEGWAPEKFQSRLYGTDWWKQHSESVRQWDTLRNVDPAEANRRQGARQAELWDLAFRLTGKKPNPAQIQMLAEHGLRFGLSEAQIRDQLVSVTKIGTGIGGEGLQVLNQLRGVRDEYVLPIHGQAMYDWTRQILAGESTTDDFKAWAQEQARGMFAGNKEMHDRIMAGQSVRQLASSYIGMAAEELGVNPDSINLRDDRWMRALHHTDPTSGARRMMNLDEWRRELRTKTEYGYDRTSGALTRAAELRSGLEEMFGVSG